MQPRARSALTSPRLLLAAMAAAALVFVGVAPAWAPHVAQLQVSPSQARAAESVTVYGPRGYGETNPVESRWNSPSGPVLGPLQPHQEPHDQPGPGTRTSPPAPPRG